MPESDRLNEESSAESSSQSQGKAQKTPSRKLPVFSKTMESLRLTLSPLTTTLQGLKLKQESYPSASKAALTRSTTGKFRVEQLQQYGTGSLAYSSLQPGLQYFMHQEYGYIAYVPLSDAYGSVCALSDPICSKENIIPFLNAFMQERNDPIFIHIRRDTAQALSDMGFCVNELGVETFIEIQNFNLVGNKKEHLRRSRNCARKENIKVRELVSVDDALFKAFKNIAEEWMKRKVVSDKELQFIVRPIVYVDEMDVRRFMAVKDNEIVGFVIFDPMYENGEVVGYIANHLRSVLERSYSVVDYIIIEALEVFKLEGKHELSLGLSPMARIDDSDDFKHSKLLKAYFQYAFHNANFLYNFKHLYEHKTKYRPESPGAHEEKVYCAMHTRFLMPRMYEVHRVLGLDIISQTWAHIKKLVIAWLHKIFGSGGTKPDK